MEEERNNDTINELIHSKQRLLILVILATVDEASFSFLKEKLDITDGALSIHLQKLENAGIIEVEKTFFKKRPRTIYRLTKTGRIELLKYANEMQKIIDTIKSSVIEG
jgi:DNA-binding HxlR family transcriptional regulator